jgi:hypothetical protein
VADMLNRTRFQPITGVVPIMGAVTVPVLQPPNTCVPVLLATITKRGDVAVHWPPAR